MRYAQEAGRPSPRLRIQSPANLFVPASHKLYAAVCKAARARGEGNVEADPGGRAGGWVPLWIFEDVRGRIRVPDEAPKSTGGR